MVGKRTKIDIRIVNKLNIYTVKDLAFAKRKSIRKKIQKSGKTSKKKQPEG